MKTSKCCQRDSKTIPVCQLSTDKQLIYQIHIYDRWAVKKLIAWPENVIDTHL